MGLAGTPVWREFIFELTPFVLASGLVDQFAPLPPRPAAQAGEATQPTPGSS